MVCSEHSNSVPQHQGISAQQAVFTLMSKGGLLNLHTITILMVWKEQPHELYELNMTEC